MGVRKFINKLRVVELVGLDAMIFIYHFDQRKPYYPLTFKIFEFLEKRKLRVITSIISSIEVLSHPPLEKEPEKLKVFHQFFDKEIGLEVEPVDFKVADLAASLRRRYHLRTPDAIQLATAIIAGADVFITNDDRFRKIKEPPVLILKDFS